MTDQEFTEWRESMRNICFRLARFALVVDLLLLATWFLYPERQRGIVIGPSIFLLVSCIFSMIITRPRKRAK